jgi:hypothetical protein
MLPLAPLLLWLGACASTPEPVSDLAKPETIFAATPASAAVAVNAPQQLQGFTLMSVDAAEDEATGTRVRYQSHAFADLVLDAFAYFVGFTDQNDAVISDFELGFGEYMADAVQQGYYRNYTPISHGRVSVEFPFGSREGAWRLFTIETADYNLLSATYLFYRPPFGIKLRASHPPTITDDMLRRHVDHFASQLLPQLTVRRNQGCSSVAPDASAEARMHAAMMGCSDYDALISSGSAGRNESPAGSGQ